MQPFYAMMRVTEKSGLYQRLQIKCEAPDIVADSQLFDAFARGVEVTGELTVLIEKVGVSSTILVNSHEMGCEMLKTNLANFISANRRVRH